MKLMIALAAGWIAFVAADLAIYEGRHTQVVAHLVGAVVGKLGFV